MTRVTRDSVAAYRTLDGSDIRELLHPDRHPVRNQSLAEATVLAGQRTALHRHRNSEEIYHISAGTGRMTLAGDTFTVQPGDSILIPPGTAHCVENTGSEALRILCACAPAYAHEDTEILEPDRRG